MQHQKSILIVLRILAIGLLILSFRFPPVWEEYASILVFSVEALGQYSALTLLEAGFTKKFTGGWLNVSTLFVVILVIQLVVWPRTTTRREANSQCMTAFVIASIIGYIELSWHRHKFVKYKK